MVSQQLVEQWRTRLAAWQQRLDEGRPQPWLARAYVRVLSYLLAQYAGQADDQVSQEFDEPARSAEVTAVALEPSGKPARTGQEIRSVLESVARRVPSVTQGPYVDGLRPDDPIVVAAYYSARLASDLREILHREGIESQAKPFRRQTQIIVKVSDLERAKPIAASHAKESCDSSLLRRQFDEEWSRKGSLTGLCIAAPIAFAASMALVVAGNDSDKDGLACAAFVISYVCFVLLTLLGWVIGLLIGTIADK